MQREAKFAMVAGVLVSLVAMPFGVMFVHRANVEESIRRGDLIISKLREYRAANGRYPNALTELVPTYLPSIPQPRVSDGWDYDAEKGGSEFWLSFDPSLLNDGRRYDSGTGRWKSYLD